jgi:hypothetical protein
VSQQDAEFRSKIAAGMSMPEDVFMMLGEQLPKELKICVEDT